MRIRLANNQGIFRLHRFITSENIAKSFRGVGTFLTHTVQICKAWSIDCLEWFGIPKITFIHGKNMYPILAVPPKIEELGEDENGGLRGWEGRETGQMEGYCLCHPWEDRDAPARNYCSLVEIAQNLKVTWSYISYAAWPEKNLNEWPKYNHTQHSGMTTSELHRYPMSSKPNCTQNNKCSDKKPEHYKIKFSHITS